MTGLACLFGLHSPEVAGYIEWRGGQLVRVHVVRCGRCFARIAEELIPVAELHQSDD